MLLLRLVLCGSFVISPNTCATFRESRTSPAHHTPYCFCPSLRFCDIRLEAFLSSPPNNNHRATAFPPTSPFACDYRRRRRPAPAPPPRPPTAELSIQRKGPSPHRSLPHWAALSAGSVGAATATLGNRPRHTARRKCRSSRDSCRWWWWWC